MELHQMIAKLALSVIEAKDKALEWERKEHDRQMNKLCDKNDELIDELHIAERQGAQDRVLIEQLTTQLRNAKEGFASVVKDRDFVLDQLAEERAQFKHLAERYEIKERDLEAAEVTIRNQIEENSDLQDANEKLRKES